MPRAARKTADSGIYHVMMRGINRQVIFEEAEDYETMRQVILDCREKSGFELYAYCLMSNHFHLLIKEKRNRWVSYSAGSGASMYIGITRSMFGRGICSRTGSEVSRWRQTTIF